MKRGDKLGGLVIAGMAVGFVWFGAEPTVKAAVAATRIDKCLAEQFQKGTERVMANLICRGKETQAPVTPLKPTEQNTCNGAEALTC